MGWVVVVNVPMLLELPGVSHHGIVFSTRMPEQIATMLQPVIDDMKRQIEETKKLEEIPECQTQQAH